MDWRADAEMSRPAILVTPSRANWRATARPTAPPAPVINATLEIVSMGCGG